MAQSSGGVRGRLRSTVRRGVVDALAERQPLSRAELGAILDLPKSTVSAVVAELLADGTIAELPARAGGPGAGSGRPANTLVLTDVSGVVVGIDVGHRHVHVALADLHGGIVAEQRTELDVDQQATAALDAVGELFSAVLEHASTAAGDVRAAAAGVPGPIDAATATVQSPTILASWVGLNLPAELRARTGLDVAIDNDANLGALGEMARGAARGYRDFIYVKASNGIGACLVLNGAPYRGASGAAGEIGHTQLDPNGDWCRCGNRGCLESVVSIDVVRRQLAPHGIDPIDEDAVTHPVGRKVLAESGRTVGTVLANLCNALNPEAIIVGGTSAPQGSRSSTAYANRSNA
jgi:predicted NBD/HSP70 family sugar kinase